VQLLSKLQYLRLLGGQTEELSPAPDAMDRILHYAAGIWEELDLKKRKLAANDLAAAYQHGAGGCACFHVKAFPRRAPDTYVIVAADPDGRNVQGHILIDLAAENSQPFFECPSFDFEGEPTVDDIRSLIPAIHPDDDNPFAVLTRMDGTYMQTLRTPEGFVLEHQLVNTTSHYEIPDLATAGEVVKAMESYAFGKHEWLEMFDWRQQILT
jgi:hypothetical protein